MSICFLEGLDRVGKSTVAQLYESKGYKVVHMSAPPKGQTSDLFLEEMMELVGSAAHQDIVCDRSYYGELIWPSIYGRTPLIDDSGIQILRELEETVGVERILMYDSNLEAHWQRCVDNKEPLTKAQFVKARALFSSIADKYGFQRKMLKDFPDAVQPLPNPKVNKIPSPEESLPSASQADKSDTETGSTKATDRVLTKEQLKLEKANVINEVLSKRIIRGKGPTYDELERNIRHFLNGELGKIFGNNTTSGFTNEETELLKFFVKRLKEKE